MADHLVTVATFLSSVEANLARNRLQEAGIPAFLSGDEVVGMSWMLGNAVGGIKLQVADEHAAAAVQTLAAAGDDDVDDNEIEDDELPRSDPADESITTKPVRRVPAVNSEEEPAAPATEEQDEASDEEEPPLGEELAARAFKAAVIGCFALPPLLHIYSVVLLSRLGSWEGELSPAGSRKAVAALVIDAIVLLSVFVLLLNLR